MRTIALGDVKPEFVELLVEAVKEDGHDVWTDYVAPFGYRLHACDHGRGEALAKIARQEVPWDESEEESDDDLAD